MKVLITGSEGYVGSVLKELMGSGFLSLDIENTAQLNGKLSEISKYKSELMDVTHIIHLADKRLEEINKLNFEENIYEHKCFLSFVKKLPKLEKIVFASSCSVYGYGIDVFHEDSLTNPTTLYAESKFKTEKMLADYKIPHVVCRFGTCYGVSPKFRKNLIIHQMLWHIIHEKEFKVYGLKNWRPYVHINDFAKVLICFINSRSFGMFNVASMCLTKEDILDEIARHIEIKDKNLKYEGVDLRDYKVSNTKLRSLGYTFCTDFQQGLKELINYYERAN